MKSLNMTFFIPIHHLSQHYVNETLDANPGALWLKNNAGDRVIDIINGEIEAMNKQNAAEAADSSKTATRSISARMLPLTSFKTFTKEQETNCKYFTTQV